MRRSWGIAPLPGLLFVLPGLCLALPFLWRRDRFARGEVLAGWSGIDTTIGGWADASVTVSGGEAERLTAERYADLLFPGDTVPASVLFLKGGPAAIVAVLLILAGILTILLPKQRFVLGAVAGLGGALALGLAAWLALGDLTVPGFGPAYGFWLALGTLLVLGFGCLWRVSAVRAGEIGFAAVAVCLALPFLGYAETVAWTGLDWSGLDLVAGGQADLVLTHVAPEPGLLGDRLGDHFYRLSANEAILVAGYFVGEDVLRRELRMPAQPAAIVAMLFLVAGVLAFLWPRRRYLIGLVASSGAAVALGLAEWLALRARTGKAVEIETRYGFWLAILLLVILVADNAVALIYTMRLTRIGRSSAGT